MRNHHNMVEQNIGIGILRDQHVSGNLVAGVNLAQDRGVLELIGHGHGSHKAGDGFVVDRDLAR